MAFLSPDSFLGLKSLSRGARIFDLFHRLRSGRISSLQYRHQLRRAARAD